MASMCSTVQSPRAAKAFSRACAARTWPAPEEAERRRTRGFLVMGRSRKKSDVEPPVSKKGESCRFAFCGSDFFEDAACEFLNFAEASEVVLKFGVEALCFFGVVDSAEDHIPKFDGVRKQRVFLQFFERGCGVVVIHDVPLNGV